MVKKISVLVKVGLIVGKKKYGIRQLNISGQKLSADTSEIATFYSKLQETVLENGLTSDQLFNCDETGLNFKMLPSKTLAAKSETIAPGYKKCKEWVTILNCNNASGSLKLKPLLIGKSKKPRAFKNVQVSCLPTIYKNQRSAWMDSNIFSEWFYEEFVPIVEAFLKMNNLPRKALLLLDNAPSHPDACDLISGDIKARPRGYWGNEEELPAEIAASFAIKVEWGNDGNGSSKKSHN
jgi:hypothetical protein